MAVPGVTLALILAVASPAQAANKSYRLTRARSCSAVRAQLAEHIVEHLLNRRPRRHHFRGRPGIVRESVRATKSSAPRARAAGDAAPASEAPSGPGHFTTTNNQVVGVDEADRIKTDGRHIYTVHGKDVLIIKSWPADQSAIVSRFEVGPGSRPTRLFLGHNKLVVFSSIHSSNNVPETPGKKVYRPSFSATRASIVDITNRARPRLIAHVNIEGAMLQARMIGTDIYVVTNSGLQLPARFWQEVNQARRGRPRPRPQHRYRRYTYSKPATSKAQLRRVVRRALAKVPVQHLLPVVSFNYAPGQPATQRGLVACKDLYFPANNAHLGMLTLSHMSLAGGKVNASAVMGSGMKLYASRSSLYVSSRNWRRNTGVSGTQIHKFNLRRWQGPPTYAASGVVPGTLLNQFSMDEHRGHLRVATTDSRSRGTRRWRGRQVSGPASNLFVLKQRQGELAVVGSVRGLAPGERIYAARMIGDRGYLVTFRRTDPLYTIDLSRPRRPRVMGELKIPGFSSYIHPVGNGQLLTVGQDADSSGRVQGAHLQIFDVTDLKNPRRTHHFKLTLGRNSSRSAAQWDHHAFTYNSRTKMLALPLTINRYHKNGGHFNGVILVQADPQKGFKDLGSVTHADLAYSASCARSTYCGSITKYWNAPIHRSIFMDDKLFTVGNHGLKATLLSKMSTLATVLFVRTKQAFIR